MRNLKEMNEGSISKGIPGKANKGSTISKFFYITGGYAMQDLLEHCPPDTWAHKDDKGVTLRLKEAVTFAYFCRAIGINAANVQLVSSWDHKK